MDTYTRMRGFMHKRGQLIAKWNHMTLGTKEELKAFDDIDKLDAEVREWLPVLLKEMEDLRAKLNACVANESKTARTSIRAAVK